MTDYVALANEIGRITADKNQKYGDAAAKTGTIFRILYPNGIPLEAYEDVLLIVRSLDKIVRITCGDKAAFGESPYRDLAGYGLLGVAKDEALREVDNMDMLDNHDGEDLSVKTHPCACRGARGDEYIHSEKVCVVRSTTPCSCTDPTNYGYPDSYAAGDCLRHGVAWHRRMGQP